MSKKPFVVCLLNGMGIEESKSYNIYSSEVMPTLDALTTRYLFSTISSSGKGVGLASEASVTKEQGLLNVGACATVKQSIEILNSKIEEKAFFNSPALATVTEHVKANNSNMHLITLVGDKYGEDSLVHLRKMVEYLNEIGIKKVCLHLYLGANSNPLNKSFPKYTAMVHRILNVYPDTKISIVAGIKFLKDSSGITVTKELYKVSAGGIGEHWINYNDAVDSNYKRKYLEQDIVPFIVHDNALIENTDGVFLFNYENDLGSVYTDLLIQPNKYMYTNNTGINIKVASLFPLQNQTSVSCLNYEPVKTSFYGALNNKGIKHLLIAPKEDIPYINYYFNGCNNTQGAQVLAMEPTNTGNKDSDLNYMYQTTTTKLMEAINSNFYDLIIVEYNISNNNVSTENIKTSMINMDKNLANIYNQIIGMNGTLIITSCYGLNEVLHNNKDELVNVNFSKKLPFVVVDNEMPQDIYSTTSGTLCDIGTTILNYLEVPLMEGMTGKNLILKSGSKSKGGKTKKSNNKTVLIIVIGIVLIVALVGVLQNDLL